MFAASVGQKFLDARRKKQVVDMLQTASGEVTVGHHHPAEGNREPDKPTGIKAILRSFAVYPPRPGPASAGRHDVVVHASAGGHGLDDHSRAGFGIHVARFC